MPTTAHRRFALHRCTVAICMALGASAAALAQSPTASPERAAEAAVHRFDIPAQPLGDALEAFARASGQQLSFDRSVLDGRVSEPLSGEYTAEQALRQLLRASGVEFRRGRHGVWMLGPGPSQDSQSAANAETMDAVVVTGTRIRGAPPASPLIVATREDMVDAGYADLGDMARHVPQNFGGGQNPGIAGGGNQGGQNNINNSSALNLRGLGPDATLTLVNGHRVAYDGLNQGVDISAIPIAAVERVEIIADGASALYGSDAVGGVANVILRREFDGAEASVRFGASTDGGNERQQYGVVTGRRWASGGFMAALDYSRHTAVTARDRSYTSALDDSMSLLPGQEQRTVVIAGHQRINDVARLELDGHYSDRSSRKATPFSATSDVFANGLLNRPQTTSLSVTPTLRLRFPGRWEGSVSATRAESETSIRTSNFNNGAETQGLLVYDNRTDAFEANAEGPLFDAPGGDARLAIGAGYRSVELAVFADRTPPGGATTTTRDFTEGQDIYFGYGELSIPLVGPDNPKPLVERLVFNAAVRHESYRGLTSVSTPKLGLIYEPHPDVTLRVSWGKSFKAPTLNQENTLAEGALLPGQIFVPPPSGGGTVLLLGGGSLNELQPERATTWTATMGIRPRAIEGLAIEASYFDVQYEDRIASPVVNLVSALGNPIYADFIVYRPSAEQVLAAISGLPMGLSNQTGQPFDPAGVGAMIDGTLRNVATVRARGVDLSADYGVDVGQRDRLRLTASASYLDSDRQLSPGQPTLGRAGRIFNPPRWRARAGGTWQRGNLSLSGFANYIGGTLDDRYQPLERVGAFLTFDAVARLKSSAEAGALRDVEAGVSVLNLLNEKPDVIRNSNPADPPYDSVNHSVVGRFIGLTLTKKFR
ncbi:TonB-dependent receptor [Luteimonas sp. Y-2-2-4F]|nr:TonB-dependent receptor [Luteimonas sp. Y-2-2-4F]